MECPVCKSKNGNFPTQEGGTGKCYTCFSDIIRNEEGRLIGLDDGEIPIALRNAEKTGKQSTVNC